MKQPHIIALLTCALDHHKPLASGHTDASLHIQGFAVFTLVYYLEDFAVFGAWQSRMCPTVLGLGALGMITFLCQWSRRRNQSVMSQSKRPAGMRLQDISHVHCPAEVCVCTNVFWPLMAPRVRKRPQALR